MTANFEVCEQGEKHVFIDNEETPIIHKTKEYSLFKPVKGNRQISETHVKNLAEFIKKRNLLKFNAILVNEKYEIIDGQHRLEAAKILGVYIYYKIGVGLTYKDAGILNACSDDWEFKEFLNAYVKNGHEAYVELEQFKQEHNLNLKRFLYLVSKEQKKIFDETFKIGTFRIIDDLEEISQKVRKIDSIIGFLEQIILIDGKRFLYTENFWKGLYTFLIDKHVDMDRFQEKLSIKYQSIRPMAGFKDYVKLFTDIYNWKAKQRLK